MNQSPAAEDHGLSFSPEGHLDCDLSCVKCAYNLRTLHRDAACPECGTAVGRAIEGNRLRYCDPMWLKQIWEGLNCFGVAIIAMILYVAVMWFSGIFAPLLVIAAPLATAIGLAVYGFFKATHPDPARIDYETWLSARRLARAAWAAAFLAFLLLITLAGWSDSGFAQDIGVLCAQVVLVALIGGILMLLVHAARLATRLPNRPLVVALVLLIAYTTTFAAMALFVSWDQLWDVLEMNLGANTWQWRDRLSGITMYMLLGLALLLAGTLVWYWYALSRAARFAWASWSRGGARQETGRG